MVKRIMMILVSVFMILTLAACGNESRTADDAESKNETETTERKTSNGEDSRILVAYFSATNTTEGVAEHIANGLNADLYEILPKEPYTEEDLDYNNDNSRSTIEMKDPDARPEISGSVENMEEYDVVFIGYPIWLAYHKLIQCTL